MSAKYENYFKVVSPFIVLVFFMSLVPEVYISKKYLKTIK